MADCYFNQDEDNYYIEAYKLYKKLKKKILHGALFQIGFYHYSGYPKILWK